MLSMYRLSIDQHVVFVRNLMTLRDQDLISPEELLSGLYPRLSIDLVFRNYQDMRIRLLLREMKLRHDVGPADRDEIERILSGKALLDSLELIGNAALRHSRESPPRAFLVRHAVRQRTGAPNLAAQRAEALAFKHLPSNT